MTACRNRKAQSSHACRAKLKAVRHCLAEEDIDALAAAAHGFVGADLAAVCDEAAMAALRRIIVSKQHPSPDPHAHRPDPHPHSYPYPHSQAKDSHVSLTDQAPADAQAKDEQVSSPQCRLSPTQPAQQPDATSPRVSLTGHAQDPGLARSTRTLVWLGAMAAPHHACSTQTAHTQACAEA